MRSRKYRLVTSLERGNNRLIRHALRAGVAPRAFALLRPPAAAAGCHGKPRLATALVLPGDDPAARSRVLLFQWDAAIGRMMASAPLTIRIDLDPP
jgi:hypothetical protein